MYIEWNPIAARNRYKAEIFNNIMHMWECESESDVQVTATTFDLNLPLMQRAKRRLPALLLFTYSGVLTLTSKSSTRKRSICFIQRSNRLKSLFLFKWNDASSINESKPISKTDPKKLFALCIGCIGYAHTISLVKAVWIDMVGVCKEIYQIAQVFRSIHSKKPSPLLFEASSVTAS